ncbi:NACHT, LRR and PYD domains-containing protein 12-like [Mantella aurantiaca]
MVPSSDPPPQHGTILRSSSSGWYHPPTALLSMVPFSDPPPQHGTILHLSMVPSSDCPPQHDGIQMFLRQLTTYQDWELRITFEYFREDLIYIVEFLDAHRLLSELKSRNIPEVENFLESSVCAISLLNHILKCGRKAIIGFWESLYVLQYCRSHPNLAALLSEIIHTGETLVKNILLDEHGPTLTTELQEIQMQHRAHLQQKTQDLTEKKPPGTTHGRKCFYISNRYVNLVLASTHHFRQLSQDELTKAGEMFEGCFQKTRSGLQNIALSRLFQWCHRLKCVPHMVIASGLAGIGKSTLIQKFVYDWVNKKHYQRFSFVFSFTFRKLNRLNKVSLEDMILDQYPYLQDQLHNILQEPEQLLFIFDGLDESTHHMDFSSSRLCANTKQRCCINMIVVSLLKKTLLEGCSVLMSSRPTKLSLITTNVFQRIVEIMGFSGKKKRMFFENFFQDEELERMAFEYVRENDSLYTFCYIPSYCWIICTVLSMYFKAPPTHKKQLLLSLPKTPTQLFVIFVAHILFNHTQDKERAPEMLTSLGRMADYGVTNRIIIFDKRHLKSFQVDTSSHLFSSFMAESAENDHVTYSFIHLIFQEFFAALIHYLQFSPENLADLLTEGRSCPNVHGEWVLRFVCGLSDNTTRAILKPYLGELSTEASKEVINWLVSILESEMLESYKKDKRRLLNVFFYLFESRNKALVSQTLKPFKCFEFFRVQHTPLHCAVLAFILDCCEEIEKLHLNECHIGSEGLERLSPVLHTIKDISIFTNDLKDNAMESICSALTHDRCKIQKLNLSDNAFTSSCCAQLASGIGSNRTLRALDLSYNNLVGPDFDDLITNLSNPLCQIEELSLRGTGLTNSSCPQLASVINSNQALTKFDLSYNNLEGPVFADLVASLSHPSCRLEELLLRYTGLSDRSLTQLASGINDNRSLRRLDLSENKVDGDHFSDLIAALSSPTCRVEELKLCGINLTDEQMPLLVQLSNNKSLKYLEFSSNAISERSADHIRDLIQASSSLQEIRVLGTDLLDPMTRYRNIFRRSKRKPEKAGKFPSRTENFHLVKPRNVDSWLALIPHL